MDPQPRLARPVPGISGTAVLVGLLSVACSGQKGTLAVYNSPPSVTLSSPADGSEFDEGTTITFEALVADSNDADDTLTVRWSGDSAGTFEGEWLVVGGVARFETANLEGGLNHTITCTVTDPKAESAQASVTVTVIDRPDAPEIILVRPLDGDEYLIDAEVEFVARVEDANDPPQDLVVQFRSDIDGVFCDPLPDAIGEARCRETLSVGRHLLTYSVTDTDGFVTEATGYMTITSKDADGDGYDSVDYGGTDCDDSNASVYPGATEVCDEIDQDCDTVIDEDTVCTDDDGDGYSENEGDCDDTLTSAYPGAPELEDAVDNDCDGLIDEGTPAFDDDGDGYSERDGDCDDDVPEVNPAATEACDGIDNDCDFVVDEENADGCNTYYYDYDGDGWGSTTSACLCSADGYYTSAYSSDCYDYNADANPGATSFYQNNRGDGSWDYNCDSSQEKQLTDRGSCSGAVWICSTTNGWDGSAAACGATGSWIDDCTGFTCDEDTSTKQQKCR